MKTKFWFVLMCALYMVLVGVVQAGVKPIVNIPDYNGTYWGSPNTGGFCDSTGVKCDSTSSHGQMFTVLYRDNYERKSGCAGEGCGKHPGVDIAVPSGTTAVAALGGKVVVSKCSSSWGGLVVIEADNPYGSGKAYVSYAHLKERSVSVDDLVDEGDEVGKTGGKSTDDCHGTSTGAHLHFQVDKPHSGLTYSSYPWYPTSRVEDKDSNFEVSTKTYNPLPFVTGSAYNFTFAETNNKEMWGASGVNSYGVASSSLWADSESSYSYVGRSDLLPATTSCYDSRGNTCSRSISLDTSVFKKMYLNISFACPQQRVIIWFKNSVDSSWHYGAFTYSTAGAYRFQMSGLPDWKGVISEFMIQPYPSCDNGGKEYYYRQVFFY